jgi:uncharacterized protein YukJ
VISSGFILDSSPLAMMDTARQEGFAMPLKRYGVLKGSVVDSRREDDADSPHYQVHVHANSTSYRVAVNVKSQMSPSELLFFVDDRFRHPVAAGLTGLPHGFTELEPGPGSLALDFIRGNLFDRQRLQSIPHKLPGPDNDLSDRIEYYVGRATAEHGSELYAFGDPWGPEQDQRDKIFGFAPGNGIHDIHMNQGNHAQFARDDGVWQDGALVFCFSSTEQWVAVFLAFQSQAWHTDDVTGHAIADPGPTERDGVVRIVGALVNPTGPAPEPETITLLNTSPGPVGLTGWKIADRSKNQQSLVGTLAAGATATVPVQPPLQLGNKGGIITLLDDRELKVDGVSYTEQDAQREGWTLVF